LTEQELIEKCIKKDANGQRILFEQYAGSMMTICRRYSCNQQEAEDMLQEAFIRAFSYIDQYEFKGSFEGWLKRIVVNSALKILQKNKIHFLGIDDEQYEEQSIDSSVLSDLNEEELLRMISNLPEGYRIVFNLYALEGYRHEEIAEMLHIKAATSRSQLSKARNMLKEQIRSLQKTHV
jgi:RNA polymerase sigma factor (sigma-70 family)